MNQASPAVSPRARRLSPAAAVFFCALVVRALVLFRVADTPHFLPNQGDMKFYSDWALRIAGGAWTDHQAFYGLPLYAYLLAGIYRLVGFQPYVALLLQAVAEAFTCLLIYKLTVRVCARQGEKENDVAAASAFGVRPEYTGWLAAAGWMLYVPAQAYSAILMPTAYLAMAFWFVVWWVLKPRETRPALRAFLLLGALMGFTAMMVANILFLLPLVLTAIFFYKEWSAGWGPRAMAARSAAAALLLGGVVAGASPCWVHNYFVAGEPVFLSAHGGINFWLGNNPGANGYPTVPAGLRADQSGMLKDSVLRAEQAVGHPLKRAEVSAFWSERAHRYIREHPGEWLRLMGRKLGNFWNAFQYDDLGVIITMREDNVLLPGPGFGFVAALALPGMALAAARRPKARWIMAASGLHMASLMMVFVTERYRLAAAPGLMALAAVGLAELWRDLAARRWQPVGVYGAVLAAGVLLVTRPVEPGLRNLDQYNAAVADMEQGRWDGARPRLEAILAATPENAAVNFALGNLWLAKGERDKAKHFYRRTLQIDPRQDRALNNLGVMAMEEKRWDLAESFLVGSLQLDSDDAKTSYLLAKTREARNDLDGALAAIDNALRLKPEQADYRQLRVELDQRRSSTVPP
jgi:hypothetical protein